jgi:RNA polymerase sigma-70 factor (ECF subfamily)
VRVDSVVTATSDLERSRVEDAAGGAAGFDAFYGARAPGLVRQLHAMSGDLTVAQDSVQEACARAWQRWDVVGGYDDPAAWVRQVAWRLAVSRLRRAKHGLGLLRRHGPPPDAPAASPDHVALVAALRRLPEAQRRALVLHHLCDLSVEQVAAETGSAAGTVKARLSRGRAALAALLSEEDSRG